MLYLRVTEVLKPYWPATEYPIEPYYLDRGHRIHSWCAAYARDFRFIEDTPDIANYTRSFREWFDLYVRSVVSVEETFQNEPYRIQGTPDLIYSTGNDMVLVDIKTTQSWSSIKYVGSAQVEAYRWLARKYKTARGGVLILDKDGGHAKFWPTVQPETALMAFLSALEAYKFFHKEGLNE